MITPNTAIFHGDMDAFYASVEVLRNPSLAGKPVIVGGSSERGVVASCSYEARAFGVRSAMSGVVAKRLCPSAVFIDGDHSFYSHYSSIIMEIFARFANSVEPLALDEAYLDMTSKRRTYEKSFGLAAQIRTTVFEETGLWCCLGVAQNKALAKLASKFAKPTIGTPNRPIRPRRTNPNVDTSLEGVAALLRGREIDFLSPMPVGALGGVGAKTQEKLIGFGIKTVGDIGDTPNSVLVSIVGSAGAKSLSLLSKGIDESLVRSVREAKSIGHEETFSQDFYELSSLSDRLPPMVDIVCSRARANSVFAKTVTVKLKTSKFVLHTKSHTLPKSTNSTRAVLELSRELLASPQLENYVSNDGVRLLGVSLSNFGSQELSEPVSQQLDLFAFEPDIGVESASAKVQAVEFATDEIRKRFGHNSLGSAAMLSKGRLAVKASGDAQWGPTKKGG